MRHSPNLRESLFPEEPFIPQRALQPLVPGYSFEMQVGGAVAWRLSQNGISAGAAYEGKGGTRPSACLQDVWGDAGVRVPIPPGGGSAVVM